ncbi:hypothetical protein ACTWQF_35355 [Streptomyces sp. 8N114]|uniref:hypothetical protein n=1 Tax=Streptomyces sp. 8N114 TaxID=3457419 RepID=UPI003FD23050
MTAHPRPTRWVRYILLFVLAVALVAAGAVGGALMQRKEPKKFTEVSGDTCHTVLTGLSNSVLDRVIPKSHYVGGWQKVSRKKGEYSALCGINADGKRALTVSLGQLNATRSLDGPKPWQGKGKKIPGFKKSWATRSAAAAALPCTKAKDEDENTSLHVKVESFTKKGDDTRKDLIRILKAAAGDGHSLACFAAPIEDGST